MTSMQLLASTLLRQRDSVIEQLQADLQRERIEHGRTRAALDDAKARCREFARTAARIGGVL